MNGNDVEGDVEGDAEGDVNKLITISNTTKT